MWSAVDDGPSGSAAGGVVLRVRARAARAGGPYAARDRALRESRQRAGALGSILQLNGPALGRSLWHSLIPVTCPRYSPRNSSSLSFWIVEIDVKYVSFDRLTRAVVTTC